MNSFIPYDTNSNQKKLQQPSSQKSEQILREGVGKWQKKTQESKLKEIILLQETEELKCVSYLDSTSKDSEKDSSHLH